MDGQRIKSQNENEITKTENIDSLIGDVSASYDNKEDNRKVPQRNMVPLRKMDRTTKKRSVLKKQLIELIDSHERTLTNWDLVRYMKTHCSIVKGNSPVNPKVRSSMESFNQSVTSPDPNAGLDLLPGTGWTRCCKGSNCNQTCSTDDVTRKSGTDCSTKVQDENLTN